jgi:polar amino acid transport system substrate-binding protein
LAGQYNIRLVVLPRARISMLLERGAKAVVVFVPSVIYGGLKDGKYLWSDPLFMDRQELVSRNDQPFEFNGPASLIDVNFGAMLGHVYPVLEKEMASEQIQADRTTSESSLFSMLMARHVQVITVPNSTVHYFMSVNPVLKQSLYISKNNLGEYSRHLMFQQGMEKERRDFNQVILKMSSDPKWIAVLKKYGLEPVSQKKK